MENNKEQEKEINQTKQRMNKIRKKFNGVVFSDSMDKTVTVIVSRVKVHPKYKKRYTVTKKYKVHDEHNKCKKDDKVVFVECRPMSKSKRWRIVYQADNNKK